MTTKLEIVDFYPTHFHDIPTQDNPAFGGDECLMVIGDNECKATKNKHAVVLHIIPDDIESVKHIAKFWKHERALKFCDSFEA